MVRASARARARRAAGPPAHDRNGPAPGGDPAPAQEEARSGARGGGAPDRGRPEPIRDSRSVQAGAARFPERRSERGFEADHEIPTVHGFACSSCPDFPLSQWDKCFDFFQEDPFYCTGLTSYSFGSGNEKDL